MYKNFIVCDESDIWALIFHHESKYGYFSSKNQALLSFNIRKFSVLSRVDDSFKIDDYFEYLLIYPEISGYSHWRQTINPIFANPKEDNGYQNISFTWENAQKFQGLSISSDKSTLLDGSPFEDTWYYSIGSVMKSSEFAYAIPGPQWKYNNSTLQYNVSLYIKIRDYSFMKKLYNFPTNCHNHEIQLHINLIIAIMI